jgi:hypothetical protein
MSVVRSWEPCKTKPISRLRIADWGLRIERGRMRAGAAGQMRKTNPISATRQDVGRGRPTCEACKTNPISPRRTRRGWRENALRLHYKRENEPNSGVESCGTNPIPRGPERTAGKMRKTNPIPPRAQRLEQRQIEAAGPQAVGGGQAETGDGRCRKAVNPAAGAGW